MKTLSGVAAVLLLMCPAARSAQQGAGPTKTDKASAKASKKPISLKPAKVSGYVFAVTKGGDLKPARLANVYMFYSRAIGGSADRVVESPTGTPIAAEVFANELINGLREASAWQADKPYLQDSTICNNTLVRGYHGAILKTLGWGQEHQSQILFGETDEEGKFEIAVPPSMKDASFDLGAPHDHVFAAGMYLVVVYGEAGYNNAFWKSEVQVEPGATVRLKMSAPTMACLKMDSQ